MELSKHPIFYLSKLAQSTQGTFHAKEYTYHKETPEEPYSYESVKAEYLISPDDLCPNWMKQKMESTKAQGTDLAISSKVISKEGKRLHLPMIDCGQDATPDNLLEALSKTSWLKSVLYYPLLVSSGRSYHIYGRSLIPEERWNEFLGHLLLLNRKGGPELVDPRWIGHRLRVGYAGLRLTCNSPDYKMVPQAVGFLKLVDVKPRVIPL